MPPATVWNGGHTCVQVGRTLPVGAIMNKLCAVKKEGEEEKRAKEMYEAPPPQPDMERQLVHAVL